MAAILWEDGTQVLWEDGNPILWEELDDGGEGEGGGEVDPGHEDHPFFISESGQTLTTEGGIPLVDENIAPSYEVVGPITAYTSTQEYVAYRYRVW